VKKLAKPAQATFGEHPRAAFVPIINPPEVDKPSIENSPSERFT
jgi:hypothetical protein